MKMETNERVRVCPYCAEQIKIAAKACPRCRNWLTALSLRNPSAAAALMIFSLIAFEIAFVIFVQRMLNTGADFSGYRDTLSVTESRMSFGKLQDGTPVINVVAVITNVSDVAWKNLQIDSRFFNNTGTLIDARPYQIGSTILPHSDMAVRITTKPLRDLTEYESQKVYVRAARDARSRLY
jgi:hypothetical protein